MAHYRYNEDREKKQYDEDGLEVASFGHVKCPCCLLKTKKTEMKFCQSPYRRAMTTGDPDKISYEWMCRTCYINKVGDI